MLSWIELPMLKGPGGQQNLMHRTWAKRKCFVVHMNLQRQIAFKCTEVQTFLELCLLFMNDY